MRSLGGLFIVKAAVPIYLALFLSVIFPSLTARAETPAPATTPTPVSTPTPTPTITITTGLTTEEQRLLLETVKDLKKEVAELRTQLKKSQPERLELAEPAPRINDFDRAMEQLKKSIDERDKSLNELGK